MRSSRPAHLPAVCLALALLGSCAPEPEVVELTGLTMGTGYAVRVVRTETSPPLEPLGDRIAEQLEELEARFSTYREDSEISRFNASPGEQWFEVSTELASLLQRSIAVSQLSDGAFDVTVGPLVELWGFGATGPIDTVPTRTEVEDLLESTGFSYVELRTAPPAVRRTSPGVRIDLSAIAKGFAVDEICALLDRAGVTDYMVEIGGEVRTRGVRADGGDWMIGIENPLLGSGADPVQDVVYLRDAAIATSGDYRNYFEHEGVRYSHTIDPRTGWPVSHGLTSVSVVGRSATEADALATALMVLGPDAGLELATRANIAARLVVRARDGGLDVLHSQAYAAYLDAR